MSNMSEPVFLKMFVLRFGVEIKGDAPVAAVGKIWSTIILSLCRVAAAIQHGM